MERPIEGRFIKNHVVDEWKFVHTNDLPAKLHLAEGPLLCGSAQSANVRFSSARWQQRVESRDTFVSVNNRPSAARRTMGVRLADPLSLLHVATGTA